MAYRIKTETYRLSMTDGAVYEFKYLDRALDWAFEIYGCRTEYGCEDGRVLLYRDDKAMNADETGAAALGVVERIVEEEELDQDYDFQTTIFDDYYSI